VHVTRPLSVVWGQEDHLNPGELPTTRWPLDKYVRDEYAFQILPGTPPGQYALNVGLYSMAGGYRLTRSDTEAAPSDSVVLATLEVMRPRSQPSLDRLGMTDRITATFPLEGVTLAGYVQDQRKVDKDDAWTLTLFWRADRDGPSLVRRDLVLIDEAGSESLRLSGEAAGYPATKWLAGEIVRDPVTVPAAVEAGVELGRYQMVVELFRDEATMPAELVVGKVKVRDR
jgi:hypothetical protein